LPPHRRGVSLLRYVFAEAGWEAANPWKDATFCCQTKKSSLSLSPSNDFVWALHPPLPFFSTV